MENLEILKGIVTDETYAALEAETKDSKIRIGDLSTDKYVSADKYKDLEKQLGKVNSALTEKTTEYDTLKEKSGRQRFFNLRSELSRQCMIKGTQKAHKRHLLLSSSVV